MKLEEQKEIWKESVASGNLLISLESIKVEIQPRSHRKNELYAIIGRFNNTNNLNRLGTIKYEDHILEISKIMHSTLELIDKIEKEDIIRIEEKESETVHQITQREVIELIERHMARLTHNVDFNEHKNSTLIKSKILILSNEEGIFSLKSYFNQRSFENVYFENWDNFQIHKLNQVDIVILNNMDLPAMPQNNHSADEKTVKRIDIIKHALEMTNCYFVHYGNYLYLINEYRDRIIAANSIFTLFSRVKEISEFASTYKIVI